ncbi:MAG: hypothetical protein HOM11_07865 [Methylococcales bacterium]|nr:hypothetical protein [Methylococcales bacterium]MBT7446126.1 hypothetical protein [Methylococcales bacterium]
MLLIFYLATIATLPLTKATIQAVDFLLVFDVRYDDRDPRLLHHSS